MKRQLVTLAWNPLKTKGSHGQNVSESFPRFLLKNSGDRIGGPTRAGKASTTVLWKHLLLLGASPESISNGNHYLSRRVCVVEFSPEHLQIFRRMKLLSGFSSVLGSISWIIPKDEISFWNTAILQTCNGTPLRRIQHEAFWHVSRWIPLLHCHQYVTNYVESSPQWPPSIPF
ncbi:hypothetical protein AMTRI_Chr13g117480 [Amborella trichopoda]